MFCVRSKTDSKTTALKQSMWTLAWGTLSAQHCRYINNWSCNKTVTCCNKMAQDDYIFYILCLLLLFYFMSSHFVLSSAHYFIRQGNFCHPLVAMVQKHLVKDRFLTLAHLFGTICLKHSATLILPPLLKPPSDPTSSFKAALKTYLLVSKLFHSCAYHPVSDARVCVLV